MEKPEIDLLVIIPHYNRPEIIPNILKSLIGLCSGIEYKIIISDNGSSYEVYRDLVYSIDKLSVDFSKITLRRFLKGTGGLGTHMNQLLRDGIPNSRFIWLLGDDDLPRSELATILTSIISKYRDTNVEDIPIAIFSTKLQPLILSTSEKGEDYVDPRRENSSSSLEDRYLNSRICTDYYKILFELNIKDSIVGLTFISNQIIPAKAFTEIFGGQAKNSINYSLQPLQVLTYCAFNSNIKILPVPFDIVDVAIDTTETPHINLYDMFDATVQNYLHVMPQIHTLEENKGDIHVIEWFLSHQAYSVLVMENNIKWIHQLFDERGLVPKYSWLLKLANAYSKKYSSKELIPAAKIETTDLDWDAMPIGVASFYSYLSGHIYLSGLNNNEEF